MWWKRRNYEEEIKKLTDDLRKTNQEVKYLEEELRKFKGYVYGKKGKVKKIPDEDEEELGEDALDDLSKYPEHVQEFLLSLPEYRKLMEQKTFKQQKI